MRPNISINRVTKSTKNIEIIYKIIVFKKLRCLKCLNDDVAREIEYVCEYLLQVDSVAISKDAIALSSLEFVTFQQFSNELLHISVDVETISSLVKRLLF